MYDKVYLALDKESNFWKTEEEVRLGWCYAIKNSLGIELQAERGRSDASYNQVIIEFKNKGLFKGKTSSPKFKEAIYDRLEKYISEKAKKDGLSETAYIGIAIDGVHIALAYIPKDGTGILHGPLMPLSLASVSLVLDLCKNSSRRAVNESYLIEDFGHKSKIGCDLMQALSEYLVDYLSSKTNNKVKMLFEEWKSLYGQVADLNSAQVAAIEKSIGFTCATTLPERLSIILFVIHTYNSIIIKILAAEIVSKISYLSSFSDFCQTVSPQDDDAIMNAMDLEIEKAGLYERANIFGFVEEALFSWYIDAYRLSRSLKKKKRLASAIRGVLIRFSSYLIDDLSHARTNDVLKEFYQNLVPDVLRKSLGEFYTPDWLVELILDKIDGGIEGKRLLDPTCGSASFLLAAINRIRVTKSSNSKILLENILNRVWGFDLNPLAVQTSRLNYLMAIADLIKDNPGMVIEIPILLADAIYSPAPDPEGDKDIVTYTIGSEIANLTITLPSLLALDRNKLDMVFETMAKCVESSYKYTTVAKKIVDTGVLTNTEEHEWHNHLQDTYNRVLSLHKKNWNGIWFRIVRNYFWSATAGEFDIIMGNPPWVRWSKLPALYRQRVKPTCMQYKIFSDSPYHGGNELDISGMITYTVADKWLKQNGKLYFLITQTHFQSGSSQGFRQFHINETVNLKPVEVEDLKMLRPFPDAANKTALLIAEKTSEVPSYPVPYIEWHAKSGVSKVLSERYSKVEVLDRVDRIEKEAIPVGEDGSPWAILPKGKYADYKHLYGESNWVQGRKGITCDLNGIYFVKIIQVSTDGLSVQIETRPEAGKTNIGPAKRFWVEPELLYPLLKGAGDLKPCSYLVEHGLYAIVPNRGIIKTAYEEAAQMVETDNPKLYSYLKNYETLLKARSTYKLRMKDAPFYCVYNVGQYTFAPWKLVWAEQPGNKVFPAAVVHTERMYCFGEKVIVPDHKIYFADFYSPEPAYYLCGLLQCETIQILLKSFLVLLQVGNIFKHVSLPKYDSKNANHCKLAKLVKEAHAVMGEDKKKKLLKEISALAETIIAKH